MAIADNGVEIPDRGLMRRVAFNPDGSMLETIAYAGATYQRTCRRERGALINGQWKFVDQTQKENTDV